MHRKILALLTALPESVHGQRIIRGMRRQCEQYGYHLAVFGSMTPLSSQQERYTIGEMNIFHLVDYNMIDGVILDSTTLQGDPTSDNLQKICRDLQRSRKIPVAVLEMPIDMPIESYHLVQNRNEEVLRGMVRHVIEAHGKRTLCFLTGQKGNDVAESRLAVFLDEAKRHGLSVRPEHIVYGDFWYFSGDTLAQEFLRGDRPLPEAVVCASDHMAIGLIDRLASGGIKIPEDLIVIGMEATEEGATNKIPLSSYEANDACSAADAVDYLRSVIEPGAPLNPFVPDVETLFHPALSCGCEPDYTRSAACFQHALYHTSKNFEVEGLVNNIDIGILMESYVLEKLTASETPEECIRNIQSNMYLLLPYQNCYLCLREDWLEPAQDVVEGYPEKMKLVAATSSDGEDIFCEPQDWQAFDTKLMLPKLHDESTEPSVFYFSPLHFNEKALGYFVLQRKVEDEHCINLVYRTWLRFVNNALEMIRSKKRLMQLSVRDEMTGILNRRGMYIELERMLRKAGTDSLFFVSVIDLDGLKIINDTYGHIEGDFAIRVVSRAVSSITEEREVCIRAGGDEFYIIGVGKYSEEAAARREEALSRTLKAMAKNYNKPYTVTASIGSAMRSVAPPLNIDEIICKADEVMYRNKVAKKRQRKT